MNAFEKINGMQVCEELLDFSKMLNDPVLLNDFRLLYIRNYFKDMKNNLSTLSINKNDPTNKKSLISNSGETAEIVLILSGLQKKTRNIFCSKFVKKSFFPSYSKQKVKKQPKLIQLRSCLLTVMLHGLEMQ